MITNKQAMIKTEFFALGQPRTTSAGKLSFSEQLQYVEKLNRINESRALLDSIPSIMTNHKS
jgi:hypothetical protein